MSLSSFSNDIAYSGYFVANFFFLVKIEVAILRKL